MTRWCDQHTAAQAHEIKMGQPISKMKDRVPCHELANDTYAVQRSSGKMETNWVIPSSCILDGSIDAPSATKHISKDAGTWRIYMSNGATLPERYISGWRRIETIEPMRLSGDVAAIEEWRAKTIELLEALELTRVTREAAAAEMVAAQAPVAEPAAVATETVAEQEVKVAELEAEVAATKATIAVAAAEAAAHEAKVAKLAATAAAADARWAATLVRASAAAAEARAKLMSLPPQRRRRDRSPDEQWSEADIKAAEVEDEAEYQAAQKAGVEFEEKDMAELEAREAREQNEYEGSGGVRVPVWAQVGAVEAAAEASWAAYYARQAARASERKNE